MPKEVLLYDTIYPWTLKEFTTAMEEAKSQDVNLRINCYGGNVDAGWSMIAKWAEHSKKKSIKVDGIAASMAALFLCYVEDVECLDVSNFMFHRAGYPAYYETNYMTEQERSFLADINSKLKEALEAKVDAAKWEEVTGISIDRLFSMSEERIDVYLTAEEAHSLGIVQEIKTITPEKKAEIGAMMRIAASHTHSNPATPKQEKPKTNIDKNLQNTNKMDIEKLKAEHPDLYKQIVEAGVSQERERVGAWMAFNEIDPEAVAKGITEGKAVTQSIMAEMTVKGIKAQSLKNIEGENPKNPETGEDPVPGAEKKEVTDFEKEVFANLKIAQ